MNSNIEAKKQKIHVFLIHKNLKTFVIQKLYLNYNQTSPHTGQNGHHQKSLQTINAGEGAEKKKLSYIVGGNTN